MLLLLFFVCLFVVVFFVVVVVYFVFLFFVFFVCLFVFLASFQLFAGPLGDINIRLRTCDCLPGIFFSIRCSSIRPFVLNTIGVFLNTGQKNTWFS